MRPWHCLTDGSEQQENKESQKKKPKKPLVSVKMELAHDRDRWRGADNAVPGTGVLEVMVLRVLSTQTEGGLWFRVNIIMSSVQ